MTDSSAAEMAEVACPACGHRGVPERIVRGVRAVYTCIGCGMGVALRVEGDVPVDAASLGLVLTPLAPPRVFIAEASQGLRDTFTELLAQDDPDASPVICASGADLLTECTRLFRISDRPQIVVLDLALPVVDGKNAALMLRALEDAFDVSPPVPLLFYTAKPCDQTLERLISYTGEARYVQRPEAAGQDEVAEALKAELDR